MTALARELQSRASRGTTGADIACEHLQPATRVQFAAGAVLQYSRTPSLRVAGFEDEDENEAPGEQ